jgi:hypothetical protein
MADAENTEVTEEEPVVTDASAEDTLLAEDAEDTPKDEQTLLADGDDPKGDDPKEEGDKDEKSEDAPDEYEEFTVPEGVELDEGLIEKFAPVAKELNLSQAQAQKLVDLQTEMVSAQQEAIAKAHAEQRSEWRAEVQALPESDKLLADAKKAINAFAKTDDEKSLLTQTWIGDNPLIINFLARVGKVAGEDSFPGTSGDKPRGVDARALYPSMKNP